MQEKRGETKRVDVLLLSLVITPQKKLNLYPSKEKRIKKKKRRVRCKLEGGIQERP